MHHQRVPGKILRKFSAAGKGEVYVFSRIFPDPGRHFDRSDVLALAMMRTALGNQDRIPVFQILDGSGSLHLGFQIPFVTGHQNGEGRQGNLLRHLLRHSVKNLRIRNDHAGFYRQLRQRQRQLRLPGYHGNCSGIQGIPDYLLLRKNQAPPGRGGINGHHQHQQIPCIQQIPDQRAFFGFYRKMGNGFLQFPDS